MKSWTRLGKKIRHRRIKRRKMKDNEEKKTDVWQKLIILITLSSYVTLRHSCSQNAAHMLCEQNRICCTGQTVVWTEQNLLNWSNCCLNRTESAALVKLLSEQNRICCTGQTVVWTEQNLLHWSNCCLNRTESALVKLLLIWQPSPFYS